MMFCKNFHLIHPWVLETSPIKTLSTTPPAASGYMTLPTPSKSSLHVPCDIGTDLAEQVRLLE